MGQPTSGVWPSAEDIAWLIGMGADGLMHVFGYAPEDAIKASADFFVQYRELRDAGEVGWQPADFVSHEGANIIFQIHYYSRVWEGPFLQGGLSDWRVEYEKERGGIPPLSQWPEIFRRDV